MKRIIIMVGLALLGHSDEINNFQKFIQTYTQRFPQALPVLTNPAMLDGILSVGTFAKEYSLDGGNIVE